MSKAAINLQSDVYFRKDYSSLYLKENQSLFEFDYSEGEKKIQFTSIKRKIESVAGIKIQEELYDLLGPYGYGGPLTNDVSEDFLKRAIQNYRKKCVSENIVCETFRFHPFNPISPMDHLFDFHKKDRDIVIVDLSSEDSERWKKYSKTTRNILRRTKGKFNRKINEVDLSLFISLYAKTMEKNSAHDFYYFNNEYFDKLMSIPGVDILSVHMENDVISSGIFLYSDELSHYHLAANNYDFSKENGNYELLEFAFEYARSKGCRYIMLGGGRSAAPEDSLFRFKAKFSPQRLPFYISGLNFLPQKKIELNELWQSQNPEKSTTFFPKYRC